MGAGTPGMNDALRDSLAVKVREFLNQMHILQQDRSTRTNRQ
jgi:hypothetical protein